MKKDNGTLYKKIAKITAIAYLVVSYLTHETDLPRGMDGQHTNSASSRNRALGDVGTNIYIYIYIYIHARTHAHTYKHTYVCVCVYYYLYKVKLR